jgi:hypothetical protein
MVFTVMPGPYGLLLGAPCSMLLPLLTYGGVPPYYYEVGSLASGAPPLGVSVDLNGNLIGTPGNTGHYVFNVCQVDSVGDYSCQPVTVDVGSVSITSFTQTLASRNTGDGVNCSTMSEYINLTLTGTAIGPVSTTLGMYGTTNNCGAWTYVPGAYQNVCVCSTGQPQTTTFSTQWQEELYNCTGNSDPGFVTGINVDGSTLGGVTIPPYTVNWQ